MTLLQAIEIAGGVLTNSKQKTGKIKISRRLSENERQEIIIDLNAILKGKVNDLILQPDDVVEVKFKERGSIFYTPSNKLPTRVIQ